MSNITNVNEKSLLTDEKIEKLSEDELYEYCTKLYILDKKIEMIHYQEQHLEKYKMRYSKLGIKVREQLNIVIKKILSKIIGNEVDIEGFSGAIDYPVIFASSHQDNMDLLNSILAIPHHFINLNSSSMKTFYKKAIELNGGVYVNRENSQSKGSAKNELISYLLNGYSVNMYPEGTYCLSPNKLHIPYHMGLIDIAQKTGRPIVPMVQEYEFAYNDKGKFYLKKVHIKFGHMLYVKPEDKLEDKLEEFEESMSSLAWDLMAKITRENAGKEFYTRSDVSEQYYKDFLTYKKKQIENAGSSLEEEEKTIYGINDEFYNYFPINSVDLDSKRK